MYLYGSPNSLSFTFDKIYDSEIEMNNDKSNIWLGRFVLVRSTPTNKIFVRTLDGFEEIVIQVDRVETQV